MEDFGAMLTATLEIFQIDFTLYGFTFSFWDVFKWSIVAGLLIWFLGGLFGGHDSE